MTLIDEIDYARLKKQENDVLEYLLELTGGMTGFPAPIPFLISSHAVLYNRQEQLTFYIQTNYKSDFEIEDLN